MWLFNNGGNWKKDGAWTINSPENVETLTFLKKLTDDKVTQNNPARTNRADAFDLFKSGKAGMVGAESVREGQIVLDVGIHVGADGNLCGDTRFAEVEPVVEAITPVPGGVGTVTSTILASHVVEAAERAANK